MSQAVRVLESFNKCVDNLLPELKKIADMDADDEIIASKMKRKIDAWFRNYGRIKRLP